MAVLSEYERKRLENIKKNQEELQRLNLSTIVKVTGISKPKKKQKRKVQPKKTKAPVVKRRSLRNQGLDPSGNEVEHKVQEQLRSLYTTEAKPRPSGDLIMSEVIREKIYKY